MLSHLSVTTDVTSFLVLLVEHILCCSCLSVTTCVTSYLSVPLPHLTSFYCCHILSVTTAGTIFSVTTVGTLYLLLLLCLRLSGAGALTIRPPTNRPRDISTHTIRPPDKPSAVTIYYCDILSQSGRIVRPPKIVTFQPIKFGRFVTVWQTVSL